MKFDTRGCHWSFTRQAKTGKNLWVTRRGKLDIPLLNVIHTSNAEQFDTGFSMVHLAEFEIKVRHDGEYHNRRHFMPVHITYAQRIDFGGPLPSWPLRARWRCEVAPGPHGGAAEVALGGNPWYCAYRALSRTEESNTLPEDGQFMAYASSFSFCNELMFAQVTVSLSLFPFTLCSTTHDFLSAPSRWLSSLSPD